MMTKEIPAVAIEQMQSTRLFAGLAPAHLAELYGIAEESSYEPGVTVINEGENGNCFYWVKTGRLEVVVQKIKGNPTPIAVNGIKSGEIFGEMILLGKNHRTASVIVRNPCTLLAWQDGDVMKFLGDHPDAGFKIMTNLAKILGDRILDMNLQIRNNAELVEKGLMRYL